MPIVKEKILIHNLHIEIDDKRSNFEEQLQWLNKISLHETITTDMLQVQDDEIYHIKLECVSEYDLEKYHTKLSQASIFYEKRWAFTGLP